MTDNNITQMTVEMQALFTDIYNNIISTTIKKAYKLTGLSDTEAKSKSAIIRRLTKLTDEGKHDMLTDFIMTKVLTVEKKLCWETDKSTIIRMFENHLIDQYRNGQTRTGKARRELIVYLEPEQLQSHINKWEDNMIKLLEDTKNEMEKERKVLELMVDFSKRLTDIDELRIFTWYSSTSRDAASLQIIINQTGLSKKTIYRRLENIRTAFMAFIHNELNN